MVLIINNLLGIENKMNLPKKEEFRILTNLKNNLFKIERCEETLISKIFNLNKFKWKVITIFYNEPKIFNSLENAENYIMRIIDNETDNILETWKIIK